MLKELAVVVLALMPLCVRQAAASVGDEVIAQVANGRDLSGNIWKTTITLVNLESEPVPYTLYFWDDAGQPLTLPIVGLGSPTVLQGTLPAGWSTTVETDQSSPVLQQGWVELKANSKNIGASAVFCQKVAGRPDFEAVVPLSSRSNTHFVLPFDNTGSYTTSMALVNPSASAIAVVRATFRDERGVLIDSDEFPLPPRQHLAFATPTRYPQVTKRKGTVEFYTAESQLSALGLRFNSTGAFTSAQTLPATVPTVTCPAIGIVCSQFEGGLVYAQDGQFLGRITSITTASDSLGYEYGSYGSDYSITSIFNPYSKYGSENSSLSAFDPYASQPPAVFIGGQQVAYLTANTLKAPRIDPRWIYPCIGRR
jgi:hypothetical protein